VSNVVLLPLDISSTITYKLYSLGLICALEDW